MKTVYDLHRFWTSMSAIFGFTFHMGRMTEVLTPDIYRDIYRGGMYSLADTVRGDTFWRGQYICCDTRTFTRSPKLLQTKLQFVRCFPRKAIYTFFITDTNYFHL